MALGNKAVSLEYYIQLAPQQSLVLLNQSFLLLKQALKDENIKEIGGAYAVRYFENKLSEIENYFKKIKYLPKGKTNPQNLTKYQKFILENNLFLNYDFGFFYDKESLEDNFFPNLCEEINSKRAAKTSVMSDKSYFSFQIFNQIMEDFITSRYNFYKAINLRCKNIDKNTNYIYTYDYTGHSLKFGILKSVFSSLYNCLDKIAHLINYYFSSTRAEVNHVNIYFDWFTSDEFKEIIIRKQNYRLLALYSLALDFKPNSPFYNLQTIRNRITHSFLNVVMEFAFSDDPKKYEISDKLLIEHIHSLFIIVKSAIIYAIIAINSESNDDNAFPMLVTLQKDIYK